MLNLMKNLKRNVVVHLKRLSEMSKSKYTVKPTKKQLAIIKEYHNKVEELINDFTVNIAVIESRMSEAVGIKDMEIFFCDGEYAGIGNVDRTMKLILANKLEEMK